MEAKAVIKEAVDEDQTNPATEQVVGGFNGNFERWFAKEEKRPRIKLDPVFDMKDFRPPSKDKRDLSKPKKVLPTVEKVKKKVE